MKICFVTQQYKNIKSGVGVYANNYISYAVNNHHEITALVPDKENHPDHIKSVKFVKIKQSRFDPTPNKWLSFSCNALKYYQKNSHLFDLIHFSDAKEAFFLKKNINHSIGNVNDCYAAVASLNPLHFKMNYPFDWLKRYFYYLIAKSLERKALKKLNIIIANSNYVKSQLIKKFHLDIDNILVIHKSIHLNQLKKADLKINNQSNIVFIGSNFQRKGLLKVIEASKKLVLDFPDIIIHVIGNDPILNQVKRYINHLSLKKHYIFYGNLSQPQVIKILKKSKILLVPSLVEALGLVYLEAMANGVIAIGSKNGGTKEIIQDGYNGFLVDPFNTSEITDKVSKLLLNDKFRQQIVLNGYKTISSMKFDDTSMFIKTFNVYQKMISGELTNL